jgi:hypothetical protein
LKTEATGSKFVSNIQVKCLRQILSWLGSGKGDLWLSWDKVLIRVRSECLLSCFMLRKLSSFWTQQCHTCSL